MQVSEEQLGLFLKKHEKELSSKLDRSNIKARILPCNEEGLKKAGELIREGKLVSFPTETVYGLAANAFDETAVRKIFETKRRPLSDPVIVHITDIEKALEFVDINKDTEELFRFLAGRFWPGPFTCVLKANLNKIPEVVTASTGYVGVRHPNNKIAQDFINSSQRPIAAPSANLFSHVSPTSPVHVFNDFYDKDVSIIDGGFCDFGIESTVVKIFNDADNKLKLLILRVGSLSEKAIKETLATSEKFQNIPVEKFKKEAYIHEATNSEAPGMLLKHYSPYVETFLLDPCTEAPSDAKELDIDTKSSILIDFANTLKEKANDFLFYYTLSESGDMREAMGKLYNILRAAENIEGAKSIFILNLTTYYEKYSQQGGELPEFLETVYDKSFRSASGKKVHFDTKSNKFFL